MVPINNTNPQQTSGLLDTDEPATVTLENREGKKAVFVTCDHASNRIPRSLGCMGLEDSQLDRHIAYDIGALELSRSIAAILDAPLIYSGYSRLVVDLNRHLDDPGSMPIISEGVEIPGNHSISEPQRRARIDELFWPYHTCFAKVLDDFKARLITPVILAIHTFTPVYHGVGRPWQIGLMWDTDDRMSKPFLENLNRVDGIAVGDNQPYTALDPLGYAFDVHARGRGLPHLFIEVRQDLVVDSEGVSTWSGIIVDALLPLLDNDGLSSNLEQL